MTARRIALTPGEPAGIGPDLCVQLAQTPYPHELVVVGNSELMMSRADQLGLPLILDPFDAEATPKPNKPGQLKILECSLPHPVQAGRLDSANATYVLETLARAIDGCLDNRFAALVTAPVHKGIINEAGVPFSGHTEFLQERTGCQEVVMMLATEGLRVALVTTHLPLARVPEAITADKLRSIIRILHHDLQQFFGIQHPKILVCGLNPHAGEDGHLGREELDVIEPVLNELRAQGLDLIGPLPADTLFTGKRLQESDAVLAMYHDQGLPVLKYKGFGQAVNITLGLPIIRTSVDHGTALELAGSGQADLGSLEAALNEAVRMTGHRRLKNRS